MSQAVFRVATEFDVVKVHLSDDVQAQVDQELADGKCLGCKQVKPAVSCGQCSTCYPATMRKIAKKKANRNQLIREGYMLAPGDAGRRPSNEYTRKLAEM